MPWRVFHVQKHIENFYPKGRRIIDPHLEGNLMHRGHREVALLDSDFRGRLSSPSGLLNVIPRIGRSEGAHDTGEVDAAASQT